MLNQYFSPDYETARSRFRAAAENTGGLLTELKLDAKGPNGEDLPIDITWFGAERPRRALLVSSGVHGVEAFAGSAIQLQSLDEILPALPEDAALILIHTVNPYGMAWLRRVNESNVDLNRNFLEPDEEYASPAGGYAAFDGLLNPKTPPSLDLFYAEAAWLVARHGFNQLKQTIVGGQYAFEKGLFFGGTADQPLRQACMLRPRRILSSDSPSSRRR